ncbi:immunoglobulin-like domain-containing protein [Bacillus cereus]|uniref:immunoglobulin-like domain-containing protein n=1 Tax=Bacillus cereus TaxID=1396 RepID=UPI001304175B|nr:immunoglobulin-like domain-containing protein [Bacillus cereus]
MKKKVINHLKPIKVVTTATIVATTLFTPVMDILPINYTVVHAAETQNANIVRYDKGNNWEGLPTMSNNVVSRESDFVRIHQGGGGSVAAMVQGNNTTARNLRQFTTKIRVNGNTNMNELYMYIFSVGNVRYNLNTKQWLLDSVRSYGNVIEYTEPINYNWNEWAEVRGEIIDNDSKFQLYFNGKKVLQIKINNKSAYNNFQFGMRKPNGGAPGTYDYLDMEYLNYSDVGSNEKPVITGEANTTIKQGTTFDPLSGMSATDKEDGNVTGKIKVTENTVDSQKQGTYKIKYEVTDKDGNTVSFERTVIVVSNEKPVITGEANTTIKQGTTFDPLSGMSATDKEDGNVTGKIKITENTVDSQKQGTYKIKYEVTDKDGNTVSFERTVTVVVDEEKQVKVAKQAIDDILTDLIQTNYSHDYSIVKKGAIQVHVAQQHITEAQEKVKGISDKRPEKAQLQKEIDRAQQLFNGRSNEQVGNIVQNGLFDFGLEYWKTWTGNSATAPSVQGEDNKSRNIVKVNPNSSVEQTLTGLEPNTTYEFTLYAKTENDEKFSIGVKNAGTATVSVPVYSKEYSQSKIRFTTGDNSTTATLYLYKSAGKGSGYADIAITKKVIDEESLTQAVNSLFTNRIYNSGKGEEIQKKQAIQPGIKESDLQRIRTSIESITDSKIKEQLQKEVKRAQELYEINKKQQASNPIKNGSFEEGLNSWKPWKASDTKVGPTVVEKEGGLLNVFKLDTGASSVEQTLQVEPNTTYELASYGKTANGEKLSMGVKKMVGVVDASVANFTSEYAEQVVRFKTGAHTTSVTVYLYKGTGISPSFFDNVRLYKISS